VCFPPLTALEVAHDHVEGTTKVLEMTVSTNPAAAKIEKFAHARKDVVVELGKNLNQALHEQTDDGAKARLLMDELQQHMQETDYNFFNTNKQFEEAVRDLTVCKQQLGEVCWCELFVLDFVTHLTAPRTCRSQTSTTCCTSATAAT
jgi:hypothetical protein